MVSYETPAAIALKSKIVLDKGLGGYRTWDVTDDDGTLLNALHETLGDRQVNPASNGHTHKEIPAAFTQ